MEIQVSQGYLQARINSYKKKYIIEYFKENNTYPSIDEIANMTIPDDVMAKINSDYYVYYLISEANKLNEDVVVPDIPTVNDSIIELFSNEKQIIPTSKNIKGLWKVHTILLGERNNYLTYLQIDDNDIMKIWVKDMDDPFVVGKVDYTYLGCVNRDYYNFGFGLYGKTEGYYTTSSNINFGHKHAASLSYLQLTDKYMKCFYETIYEVYEGVNIPENGPVVDYDEVKDTNKYLEFGFNTSSCYIVFEKVDTITDNDVDFIGANPKLDWLTDPTTETITYWKQSRCIDNPEDDTVVVPDDNCDIYWKFNSVNKTFSCYSVNLTDNSVECYNGTYITSKYTLGISENTGWDVEGWKIDFTYDNGLTDTAILTPQFFSNGCGWGDHAMQFKFEDCYIDYNRIKNLPDIPDIPDIPTVDDSSGLVTANDMNGCWKLISDSNFATESIEVYIEFNGSEHTYCLYQNHDSYDGKFHKQSGQFQLERTTSEIDTKTILSGSYAHDAGNWAHHYYITIVNDKMRWVARDDYSMIQEYVRIDSIPEEVINQVTL